MREVFKKNSLLRNNGWKGQKTKRGSYSNNLGGKGQTSTRMGEIIEGRESELRKAAVGTKCHYGLRGKKRTGR